MSYLKDRNISSEKQLIKAQKIDKKLKDNLNNREMCVLYLENRIFGRLPDINNMPEDESTDLPIDKPIDETVDESTDDLVDMPVKKTVDESSDILEAGQYSGNLNLRGKG